VVDFGCGGGNLLASLPGAVKTGIEINVRAREAAAELGLATISSARELPAGYADVVISNHALEHMVAPCAELGQIARILTPEGKLVLWLPLEDWRQPHHRLRRPDPNHHLYGWTPLLLRNLLEEAGFEVDQCRVVTHAWPARFTSRLCGLPPPVWHALCRVFAFVKRRRQLMAVAYPAPRTGVVQVNAAGSDYAAP
jgi:SAM-dependent methyltransferase